MDELLRGVTVKGRLLTASCTTGWRDWIHGELWLFADGLLRMRSGLIGTIAHWNGQTVPGEPEEQVFGPEEIERLRRAHHTNLWIPANEIVTARIRSGALNCRLSLTLVDGRRVKWLWLRADPAAASLKEAFAYWGVATSGLPRVRFELEHDQGPERQETNHGE
jgi:hypothetical protein